MASTVLVPRRRPKPGLLSRVRSFWQGPFSSSDAALLKALEDMGVGPRTVAGVPVTYQNAFTFSAVFDAVNQISSDIAKLPLNLMKRTGNGGSEPFVKSPMYRMLKLAPNPETGSMALRRVITANALTWGNGYAEIERDGAGRPIALWHLPPDRVTPKRDAQGNLYYQVTNYDQTNETVALPAANMLHIAGLGYDPHCGYSVVNYARQAIGLAIAAEQFGAAFFGNGATFGGILTSDQPMPDEQEIERYRGELKKLHQGASRAHQLGLFFGGVKWNQTSVAPDEAQMNELRSKQVEEVARFFNMPVHKLKNLDRATNNNIEQQDLEYWKGPILNQVTTWEEELNRKLVPALEWSQQYIKHNVDVLLRADIASRFNAYSIALDKGLYSRNEIRRLEDMNPQDDPTGDMYFVQSAQVPIDLLPKLVQSKIEKNDAATKQAKNQPPPAPVVQSNNPNVDPQAGARAIALLEERIQVAEKAEAEARAKADAEREARLSAEASGTATQAEIEAMRAAESKAAAVLMGLEAIKASIDVQYQTARTQQAEAERALAEERTRAAESLDRAQTETAQARAAKDAAEASLAEMLRAQTDAEARATAATSDVAAAQADAQAARSAADEAKAAAETLAVQLQAAKDAAEASRQIAADLQADRDAAVARSADIGAELLILKSAIDAAIARAEAADAAAQAADTERARAIELAKDSDRAAEALSAKVTELESVAAAAEMVRQDAAARVNDAMDRLAEAGRSAADLADRVKTLEASLSSEQTARTSAEQSASAFKQRLDETASATMAAHRALYRHTMQLMIERETERGRRVLNSPEKLRAWQEAWYESHEALMATAISPIVRVHLAFLESSESADAIARSIAKAHVEASRAQVEAVTAGDADAFARSVAQLFDRWDRERADAFADGLFTQEMDHVRTRAT